MNSIKEKKSQKNSKTYLLAIFRLIHLSLYWVNIRNQVKTESVAF